MRSGGVEVFSKQVAAPCHHLGGFCTKRQGEGGRGEARLGGLCGEDGLPLQDGMVEAASRACSGEEALQARQGCHVYTSWFWARWPWSELNAMRKRKSSWKNFMTG